MTVLREDITAFDRVKAELEEKHRHEWVVFYRGEFIDAFTDFEAAASAAVERFDTGPYLIRQVGAPPISLPGGMIFTPAHVLGASGI